MEVSERAEGAEGRELGEAHQALPRAQAGHAASLPESYPLPAAGPGHHSWSDASAAFLVLSHQKKVSVIEARHLRRIFRASDGRRSRGV